MAKSELKIQARSLRTEGKSIKEIAYKLDVSVGSVSIWCRDILLTPQQIKELEIRAHDPFYGKRQTYLNLLKKRTQDKIETLRKEGINEIGLLTQRELFLVGIALYWAEGFKKDSQAGFANSNPLMIKIFLRWIRECCDFKLDDLSFRITLNQSHEYRIKEVQRYWAQVTQANPHQFQKPFFQQVKWQKTYDNPENYYGVLRIKVRKSTDFLRRIHGWIEGIALN